MRCSAFIIAAAVAAGACNQGADGPAENGSDAVGT